MKLRAALGFALLFQTSIASASLTSSEIGQVKDFVARGQIANVTRVRALVVRTDLSAEESTAIVVDALSNVTFDETRAAFLRELVFGGSSSASRPMLTLAVTKGLLARADGIHQRFVGGLDHEPRGIAELAAIYAFLDTDIANAGKPTETTHDATAGIPTATYEACSKALADHIDRNARWLKGASVIAESVARVRAQAQIALVDMQPDATTRRIDAAVALGLDGARKQMLTDWGILFADAGKVDAGRVKAVLAKLPGARAGVSLIFAGEDRGDLHARSGVGFVGHDVPDPFGEDVQPAPHDAAFAGVVHDLAVMAAKQGLETHADLRAQAEKDALATRGDKEKRFGLPRAPSVDHYVGAALSLVLLDPQRAIDLAAVRFLGGHPESAAMLSDALAVVGAPAVEPVTKISGGDFTFDGHAWSVQRGGPNGVVVAIKRDGQNVSFGQLPTARLVPKEGDSWTDGTTTFTRMRGTPKVAVAPTLGKSSTVTLAGNGTKGLDAIVTTTPASFVLEGDLVVRGGQGGIAIRAANGRDGVRGLLLLVTPGSKAVLASSDDAGAETQQGAAIDPAPSMPVHVKITTNGTKIEAVVGTTTLTATGPAGGEVGLVARRGARVELRQFSLKKR